jgi:hypothetical protein
MFIYTYSAEGTYKVTMHFISYNMSSACSPIKMSIFYTATNALELSPSSKFNIGSATHIPQHFMEPKGSLPCSQKPATGLYFEPYESTHTVHPTSPRSTLILSFHLLILLPSVLLPSGFLSKTLCRLLFYGFYMPCRSPPP